MALPKLTRVAAFILYFHESYGTIFKVPNGYIGGGSLDCEHLSWVDTHQSGTVKDMS